MQLLNINSILLWMVVLFNLILTLVLIRRLNDGYGEPIETLRFGQAAPDFIAETLQGERVTLANYVGQGLAFVFISPTCKYCRQYIPDLEILGPQARKLGVEIILISDSETNLTKDYVQDLSISLPVLSAPRQGYQFLSDYKVGGVPFYAIIDPRRKVLSSGVLNDPQWKEQIARWRKEEL